MYIYTYGFMYYDTYRGNVIVCTRTYIHTNIPTYPLLLQNHPLLHTNLQILQTPKKKRTKLPHPTNTTALQTCKPKRHHTM